ncbi:MAG: hypothetical protein Q9169_000370 [Polycauliona sp. 2 TL-2023]
MEPEPSSHLHQCPGGVGHGVVSGDLRSWSSVRANRSNQRMCAGVHSPADMLHQAEHTELEDDTGVFVCSVRGRGDVDQPGAGNDENHSHLHFNALLCPAPFHPSTVFSSPLKYDQMLMIPGPSTSDLPFVLVVLLDEMDHQLPSTDGADVERAARLRRLQMEALGTIRRDHISTHDVADRFDAQLSTPNVEQHRRLNQTGTSESKVAGKHRENVAGWNAAWLNLQNDEALEQGLEDLNAGQSHRARLLVQAQERPFTAPEPSHRGRGGSNPRGTGRGGRGGGVGNQPLRAARKRVPIDDDKDQPARRVVAPRLATPSALKIPFAPALKVKLPGLSGSSTASNSSRVRIQPGNFTLVASGQFMSHVSIADHAIRADSPTAAHGSRAPVQPKMPLPSSSDVAGSNKPPTLMSEAVSGPVSTKGPQMITTAPPVQEPIPATTLPLNDDTHRSNDEQVSSTRVDEIDLLGMDIDNSNQLPTPMQLSARNTSIDRSTAQLPRGQPSLELFKPQITEILTLLRNVLPGASPETLKSIRADVARQIQVPTAGVTREQSNVLPSEPVLSSQPERQASVRESLPSRGLANAVQQRTLAWGQDVISGAESGSTSILGENISRYRFSRRRVSVDSLASVVSAGSSTALTEQIDQLRIGEFRPSNISSVTGSRETYAATNPFRPKPTPRGSMSSIASTIGSPTVVASNRSATRATGPQLPLFLRSQDRTADPAAAIQAEFAANTAPPSSPSEPARQEPSGATGAAQRKPHVNDRGLSQDQRYSQEAGSIRIRVGENPIRNGDSIVSRNSSISTERVPEKEVDEEGTQSRRQSSIRAGPRQSAGVSNAARTSSAISTDGTLPRFHPRLGNQHVSPPRGPRPTQTYFPAGRKPARAPPPGPALPSFLANMQAAADPGAAAVEQYSREYGSLPPPKKDTGD